MKSVETLSAQMCNAIQPRENDTTGEQVRIPKGEKLRKEASESSEEQDNLPVEQLINSSIQSRHTSNYYEHQPLNFYGHPPQYPVEQPTNSQSEAGQTSISDDQSRCQAPVLEYQSAVNHQYPYWQSPYHCTTPYLPAPCQPPCQQQHSYQFGYHHSPHPFMQHQGNVGCQYGCPQSPCPSEQRHGNMQIQQFAPQQQLHQHQEVAHPGKERLSENLLQDISTTAAISLKERPTDTREDNVRA